MRAAIVFLFSSLLGRQPFSASFFSLASFFSPKLLLARPESMEQPFARGTRLLPDREAIDRERGARARARWLPPKGRPNGPTWRDRTPIFHLAHAFELRVLARRYSRERTFCAHRRQVSRPFSLFLFALGDWKIICRVTCGYCGAQSFSRWPFINKSHSDERSSIYHFEHVLHERGCDWQFILIGI